MERLLEGGMVGNEGWGWEWGGKLRGRSLPAQRLAVSGRLGGGN